MLKNHLEEGMEAGELYNLVPINLSKLSPYNSFSVPQVLSLPREGKGGGSGV